MKKEQVLLQGKCNEPENRLFSGVGTRSRLRREELNLSRSKVAKLINVSLSTLQAWENQEREPSASDILRLSEALGVSASWLLCGEAAAHNEQQSVPPPPSNKDHTLMTIWESLEPIEKELLSKLLLRKGSDLLTQLLDNETICLMQLTGERRDAALLLARLLPKDVREILSEMRKRCGLADEDDHQVAGKQSGVA
ncbi:helix-turn-helix domain-containing protein [Salmonella enterica]